MKARVIIYAEKMDVFDFLMKANWLPEKYALWEDQSDFLELVTPPDFYRIDMPGVYLEFPKGSLPIAFIKFLIANKQLLNRQEYKNTTKELHLLIDNSDLDKFDEELHYIYTFQPGFIRVLADYNIILSITKKHIY